ncbi:hypothetical protein [Gottfriedia acidiceleris]|uniref:Uncharacterized protein n=1 Tax=Gottfriedia acidiceleris TaxID=371036 RepID=A0ABY4JUM9_9BACI|nr:hypothetical protein [Gottfriedia acidiceleris]UPM56342.1 hypothetical protein MY490_11115 [Gottfriedia acidiceleris]
MNKIKDALFGASEIALELEKVAIHEQEHGTVDIVEVMDIHSGAMNVVQGEILMKIDFRFS